MPASNSSSRAEGDNMRTPTNSHYSFGGEERVSNWVSSGANTPTNSDYSLGHSDRASNWVPSGANTPTHSEYSSRAQSPSSGRTSGKSSDFSARKQVVSGLGPSASRLYYEEGTITRTASTAYASLLYQPSTIPELNFEPHTAVPLSSFKGVPLFSLKQKPSIWEKIASPNREFCIRNSIWDIRAENNYESKLLIVMMWASAHIKTPELQPNEASLSFWKEVGDSAYQSLFKDGNVRDPTQTYLCRIDGLEGKDRAILKSVGKYSEGHIFFRVSKDSHTKLEWITPATAMQVFRGKVGKLLPVEIVNFV